MQKRIRVGIWIRGLWRGNQLNKFHRAHDFSGFPALCNTEGEPTNAGTDRPNHRDSVPPGAETRLPHPSCPVELQARIALCSKPPKYGQPALGIPLSQPHRPQDCKWPEKVNRVWQVQPSEKETASIRKHCVSQQGRQASSFPGKVQFPRSRNKGCGGRKYTELREENGNAPTLWLSETGMKGQILI